MTKEQFISQIKGQAKLAPTKGRPIRGGYRAMLFESVSCLLESGLREGEDTIDYYFDGEIIHSEPGDMAAFDSLYASIRIPLSGLRA